MYINTCSIKHAFICLSFKIHLISTILREWEISFQSNDDITCFTRPHALFCYITFLISFLIMPQMGLILLFCPEKKHNHSGNSYIALPETVIFHKKIFILFSKNCNITLVCNCSAYLFGIFHQNWRMVFTAYSLSYDICKYL